MAKSKSSRSRRVGARFSNEARQAAKLRQASGKSGWTSGHNNNPSRKRRRRSASK